MLETHLGLNTQFHLNNKIIQTWPDEDGTYVADIVCENCKGYGVLIGYSNSEYECRSCVGHGAITITLENPNTILKEIL